MLWRAFRSVSSCDRLRKRRNIAGDVWFQTSRNSYVLSRLQEYLFVTIIIIITIVITTTVNYYKRGKACIGVER